MGQVPLLYRANQSHPAGVLRGPENNDQCPSQGPQHTAVGFKQTVHKLLIVVELLLGEIPDRLQFRQPSLKRSLMPYFLLTQAVRTGNLAKFNQVLDQFGRSFKQMGPTP